MRGVEQQRAFTLLELLVVMVIISMIAAVAATHLIGAHHAALRQQAVGQWAATDQLMRQHAARYRRPTELVFEMQGHVLTRGKLERRSSVVSRVELPKRVAIQTFLSPTRRSSVRHGQVKVRFNSFGQTDTYAVCLKGPDDVEQWLLFLGATGELKRGLTKAQINDAIRLVSTTNKPRASR